MGLWSAAVQASVWSQAWHEQASVAAAAGLLVGCMVTLTSDVAGGGGHLLDCGIFKHGCLFASLHS